MSLYEGDLLLEQLVAHTHGLLFDLMLCQEAKKRKAGYPGTRHTSGSNRRSCPS